MSRVRVREVLSACASSDDLELCASISTSKKNGLILRPWLLNGGTLSIARCFSGNFVRIKCLRLCTSLKRQWSPMPNELAILLVQITFLCLITGHYLHLQCQQQPSLLRNTKLWGDGRPKRESTYTTNRIMKATNGDDDNNDVVSGPLFERYH